MPELPEVETVKETLKRQINNQIINDVDIYYSSIIEYPGLDEFKNCIKGQKINDIERRGKWLMFRLDNYYLLSHLRMEGRYYVKHGGPQLNHELVDFHLSNCDLKYIDTRKFGRMYLVPIDQVYNMKPINELGLEPWDSLLTISYLKNKYSRKSLPIKSVLLDQSIIAGIGNIYADEILFISHIYPYKKAKELSDKEINDIIINTRFVLEKAIQLGGTTIRTYESSEGIHGRFQNELLIHGKRICPYCKSKVIKEYINGRGTYYCSICQK